ncbi:hypothetical protein LSAT2_032720 [Lamellibrachia satsuma]|nr:hypothetical protein LSAT2_032720 [Lamellibrachia satsuma]
MFGLDSCFNGEACKVVSITHGKKQRLNIPLTEMEVFLIMRSWKNIQGKIIETGMPVFLRSVVGTGMLMFLRSVVGAGMLMFLRSVVGTGMFVFLRSVVGTGMFVFLRSVVGTGMFVFLRLVVGTGMLVFVSFWNINDVTSPVSFFYYSQSLP